ncbi:MAG: hypothetical protein M1608_06200, partial [Candidatus Omnitrophica bacterium]|nr:hypothetical protein [Candidatus Omnitrophota bacterium]
SDPWPRGTGHVILAIPGSRQVDKAYHEPGGSFSPAAGSFGISLWVTDSKGTIQTTSDSIPIDQVRQQLTWPDRRGIPAIRTDTDYYRSIWSSLGLGSWQLQLHPHTNSETLLDVVVRSVGPAGDPINTLDWNGQRLLINRRWALTCEPLPSSVFV